MKLERAGTSDSERQRTCPIAQPIGDAVEPVAISVDLCSGLGGLSLAAKQLGLAVVVGVDTDEDSLKTFAHNFPGAVAIKETIAGTKALSACRAAIQRHPRANRPLVVLSGPPCQGFSAAGSRDPKDKRNKVLLGVARAITTLKPRCALIENVQELLASKHKRRLKDFRAHFAAAGYRVLEVKLDAKDYGVAQKRERAFFLITKGKRLTEKAILRRLKELQQPEVSCGSQLDELPPAQVRGRTYSDEEDVRARYPNHLAMRHSDEVKEKIRAIKVGRGPMSYRKLDPSKPANTLFSGHRAPPAHYRYPRSITVREAARLQGFPDTFAIRGEFSNQMQQISNAVPPPLARAVLRTLLEFTGILDRRHG